MDQTTIGKLLTQKREQQNISLKEVAEKTKININILRSLEADDLDKLPNKTYVKGFVQNYAKTVGLNIDEAAQILQETYQAQNPEEEIIATEHEEANSTHISESSPIELTAKQLEIREKVIGLIHKLVRKQTLISIAAVVVVIFVIKGLVSFFTKVSNEQVKIKPQTASSKTIKSSDESLFDIKATKKLTKNNTVKSNQQNPSQPESSSESIEVVAETKSDTTTQKEAEQKEQETTEANLAKGQVPYKTFYPAPINMYEVAASAPENVNENLIPINIRESVMADKENVFINATEGDTWISYQTDDNDIKRYILKKGRHLIIRGKVILLFLGNAKMTKIFYNNQLVKFQTRTGVKSLIFPPSQIKNYELPLFPSYKGVPYKQKVYKEKMASSQE
jgi:cytoskeleton protein RodZ